jgi:hypothetical protein
MEFSIKGTNSSDYNGLRGLWISRLVRTKDFFTLC